MVDAAFPQLDQKSGSGTRDSVYLRRMEADTHAGELQRSGGTTTTA